MSKHYPSNLTEAQWAVVAPLLPKAASTGRPRQHDLRVILNAVFYVLRTGCPWRYLPADLPPWPSVHYYFRKWRDDGTWVKLMQALRVKERVRQGRDPEPTALIIDSQTVKTTEKGGPCGYDGGKHMKGRKRTILVDTLGLLISCFVHRADESDSEGGYDVVERAEPYTQQVGKLWTDNTYRGEFAEWVERRYGWTVEVVGRLTDTVGFVVRPHRWIVERTFGWLGRCRRLSKDYEEYPESSEAWISLAMSHLLIRRLASAT